MDNYIKALNSIIQNREDALQELGLKVRNEVVAPVCKKHKLKYVSGMGTFVFFKGAKSFGNISDLKYVEDNDVLVQDLKSVFELLNTEIDRNNYLGFYVGDVR